MSALLRFAVHRSDGKVGRLIRWQTDGEWSHVSLVLDDGRLLEAREGHGVVIERTLADAIAADAAVRVLGFPCTDAARETAIAWARTQVGKGYDYAAIARFLTRFRKAPAEGRWICSELGTAIARQAGALVQRDEPAWKVTPRSFASSPDFIVLEDCRRA